MAAKNFDGRLRKHESKCGKQEVVLAPYPMNDERNAEFLELGEIRRDVVIYPEHAGL